MDQILVLGDEARLADFRARTEKLEATFQWLDDKSQLPDLQPFSVVFDLCLDEQPARLRYYAPQAHLLVIGGAVKRSLAAMAHAMGGPLLCRLAGINALPSFLRKAQWELSAMDEQAQADAQELLDSWQLEGHFVADRVGMVTPRILAMIINEACFTVQEGTATEGDIDQAMRLGVNYPGGPFEWAEQIGYSHICELLQRMSDESRDSRYKIAPFLLQKHWKHA